MSDESVFPRFETWTNGDGVKMTDAVVGGLSKRELFAAFAMHGLLSAVYSSKEMLNEFTSDSSKGALLKHVTGRVAVTSNALAYADALLAELAKKAAPVASADRIGRELRAALICIEEMRYGHDCVGHFQMCSDALKKYDATIAELAKEKP